jgi:cysteinyl-tRNA synthetase
MCLQAHYRSEMEFTWEGLAAALTRLKRLVQAVVALRLRADDEADAPAVYRDRLDAALSDDLNTPKALPLLDELIADKALSPAARMAGVAMFDAALGLQLSVLSREELRLRPKGLDVTDGEIASRLAERGEAKKARDFATADALRAALATRGVEVMDGDPLGWEWRLSLP